MKKKFLVSFLTSLVAVFALIFFGSNSQSVKAALNNTLMVNNPNGAVVFASASPWDPAGRTLSNGSTWAYSQVQIGGGNIVFAKVATNEWIETNDAYKLADRSGTVHTNKSVSVYSSPVNGSVTQTLASGTSWSYNGVAVDWQNEGIPNWVRVSTNGWVRGADVSW